MFSKKQREVGAQVRAKMLAKRRMLANRYELKVKDFLPSNILETCKKFKIPMDKIPKELLPKAPPESKEILIPSGAIPALKDAVKKTYKKTERNTDVMTLIAKLIIAVANELK